jgi:hypothetical protein
MGLGDFKYVLVAICVFNFNLYDASFKDKWWFKMKSKINTN